MTTETNKNAYACSKELWDKIFYGEKLLNDKEAKEMQEYVAKLRKEYGFR